MLVWANKFRNHIPQTQESFMHTYHEGIELYRVFGRPIARDVGLSIMVTRYFAYSRARAYAPGIFYSYSYVYIYIYISFSFCLFLSLFLFRDAHMLREYFSRDTKVSEFANVENVPIAALMHVFMHGRSCARLWKMPSIFSCGTRYF